MVDPNLVSLFFILGILSVIVLWGLKKITSIMMILGIILVYNVASFGYSDGLNFLSIGEFKQIEDFDKCKEVAPESTYYDVGKEEYVSGSKVYECKGWIDGAKTHTSDNCFVAVGPEGAVIDSFCFEKFYPTIK